MPAQWWTAGVLIVAISLVLVPASATGQTAPTREVATPATVALVETWSDGHINYELTTARRGSMWTPRFSRVEGYQLPQGAKPVYAVQIARVLVGSDIKVDVSVLLGSAEPPGVPVASVLITPTSRVVVHELTKFGVQPLMLSMVDTAPMTPYLPTTVSVSPLIEVAYVELLTVPYPGYRITLRNLGSKGASSVHVQSYRGEEKALSTLKRSDDGRPMMQPGGTYTFDMNLTSGAADAASPPGSWSPRAIDVIEFKSVRWDDGTYDGVPPFPQIDAVVESDSGRRLQLRRIVEALSRTLAESGSGADLLTTATTRINALPGDEPEQLDAAKQGMRSTKATVRADIARFERDGSPRSSRATRDWLTSLLRRYEGWLKRLSPP